MRGDTGLPPIVRIDRTQAARRYYAPLILSVTSEFITLANTSQARKRVRQAEKHRAQNVAQRSMLRTTIKKVVKAVEAKDKTAAEAAFKEMVPVLDRHANRGLIHKNKAARHKSRLALHIKSL